MSRKRIILNKRDYETLNLLVDPHTPQQILTRSTGFESPFQKVEHVRRRLRELRQNNLVQTFDYQFVRDSYHKLARIGFQLLFPHSQVPHSRFFGPVSYGSQPHTHGVTESLGELTRLFSKVGLLLENVSTEPRLHSVVAAQLKLLLRPDAVFELKFKGKTMRYFLEYDCSTEPICTRRDRESLSRKVQRYDEHSMDVGSPFKVLFVFQSSLRQQHFLDMVSQNMINPKGRTLFYSTTVSKLANAESVDDLSVVDHRRSQWLFHGFNLVKPKFVYKELAPTA